MQLPSWHHIDTEGSMHSRLEDSQRDITWPHLYELSLSSCEVSAEYLIIGLCLRHKATLRRLSLFDVQLDGFYPSWKEVFTSLSGQLPELRRIKLRGMLYTEGEPQMEFEVASMEPRRVAPYRDALENFVIKGGDWPSGDSELLPDQGDYPNESYEPPGRWDDDKKPDDPALDCEADEFDWRI